MEVWSGSVGVNGCVSGWAVLWTVVDVRSVSSRFRFVFVLFCACCLVSAPETVVKEYLSRSLPSFCLTLSLGVYRTVV